MLNLTLCDDEVFSALLLLIERNREKTLVSRVCESLFEVRLGDDITLLIEHKKFLNAKTFCLKKITIGSDEIEVVHDSVCRNELYDFADEVYGQLTEKEWNFQLGKCQDCRDEVLKMLREHGTPL